MTRPAATHCANVLLVGSDFADDPLAATSGDKPVVLHVGDAGAIPETLEREVPSALVVRARHLGLGDWLAIHQFRSRAPDVLLVLVTTARMSDSTQYRKESNKTVLLPWPSTADEVRRALRGPDDLVRAGF